MSIYLGNTLITQLFLGTSSVSQAYLGNNLVFGGNGSPLPTRTPTKTPTPTPSSTSSPSPSPTATPTPSRTAQLSSIVLETNTANFNGCADWNGLDGNLTDVGTNGKTSSYGTYDQSGNIWEWTEAIVGSNRVFRGGNWQYEVDFLSAAYRNYNVPLLQSELIGGRIGSYTNPLSLNNFTLIVDINNQADNTGYGSVAYLYLLNKYELTNSEYIEFLNSVAASDTKSLYNAFMASDPRAGITRSGSVGSYTYTAKNNMSNKPVNFISWFSLARYCNWLHNGKPTGPQNTSTTENGAYDMTQSMPTRKIEASYFIPSEDEWYKAAFYKSGTTSAGYWDYATQSDTPPTCIRSNNSGIGLI